MCGVRTLCGAAMKIGIVLLVVGASMLAASCGKDGSIYGSVTWDYWAYGNVGGFPPPSSIVPNAEYQVSAGTHEVIYYICDGTYYWPGGTLAPQFYWDCLYTVAADKGSFPLVNGQDSYFSLYLSMGGMYKAGSVNSIQTPAEESNGTVPAPAPQTWTQNGLIITVTNKAVAMTPDVLSKLGSSELHNK